ncbi:tripartite tricarboxylate transporter permease [Sporosarcina cascadiensis]|uniref:tripartite tricarboxylate transporter permease n=1 Tax=Sporosarcina cascadiensis TaxID=2660747 RepID=UPI00129AFCBE|nr:tripartite tricarboxylate transporter permease [Sporosarcina cascadiensis]
MIDMIMTGFGNIFGLQTIILITLGVTFGLMFGSIPGLTATMGIALALPITYGMDPINALALLMSIFIGGVSGGFIPAVLINLPGTPSSIATTFDGYPMTQKGQGAKALGLAIISSFVGGMFSFMILILIAPGLASIALKFGPFEYFAIAIFSLTMIASLSGNSMVKGVLSALLGIGLTMIGAAPVSGTPRFTFGITSLDGGFDILIVMIGLFAVSEIIKFTTERYDASQTNDIVAPKVKWFGVKFSDVFKQRKNMLRSSVIGTAIGILPGIGGGTSNFLAYVAAKNGSKKPEEFGKGNPEGVVAPECANNASIGGAMVPLVTLGIPGDAATAILLGGLILHGLTPGPMLFTNNGDVVYSIFASMIIANIILLILFLVGIKFFIKVLKIPKYYLLPIVVVLCALGAYGLNNRIFDIGAIFAFGLIGYLLQKYGFPLTPMILGFILAPIAETNLLRGLMVTKGSFLPFITSPIAGVFLLLALGSVLFAARKQMMRRKEYENNQI